MACAFPGAVPGSLKVSCLGQRPATKRAEAAGAHLCCVFPSDGHHGQPGPGLTFGAVFLARLRTSATNWSDAVQVLSFNAPWDGCSEWQPSPRADLCRPGLFFRFAANANLGLSWCHSAPIALVRLWWLGMRTLARHVRTFFHCICSRFLWRIPGRVLPRVSSSIIGCE